MTSCASSILRRCCLALALCSLPVAAHDCTLSLSQAQIDLGSLRLGSLPIQPGQSELSLGLRRLSLTIVCPRSTAMLLRFEGAAAGPQAYRLARGYFTVGLGNARLDGEPVSLAVEGRPEEHGADWLMAPGRTVRVLAQGLPAKGRFFSAQVEVEPRLPLAMSRVGDETEIQGRGRFELVPGE
ncbi:hypothetical protein ACMGT0_30470 [Pseudomonas sp. RHF3.3-3]|uniref:hypothetical protein n=1 Tax=Pseudomonas sp. RHF3.3-3 TaxID=3396624 RepID=UPI003A835002